jgi:hypothetical protein
MARVSFHIFLHCVFGPQTDKPSVVEKGGEERGAGDGGAEFRNKTKGKMMKCGQPNPVQGRKNRKSLTKGSKEREEREREREEGETHNRATERERQRDDIYFSGERKAPRHYQWVGRPALAPPRLAWPRRSSLPPLSRLWKERARRVRRKNPKHPK